MTLQILPASPHPMSWHSVSVHLWIRSLILFPNVHMSDEAVVLFFSYHIHQKKSKHAPSSSYHLVHAGYSQRLAIIIKCQSEPLFLRFEEPAMPICLLAII